MNFIIGILIFLHVMVPLWTRHLCKNTDLSRVKLIFASIPPIFLLLSIYCSAIILIPLIDMGNAFGGSDEFFVPFFQGWVYFVIIGGLPFFAVSYVFAAMTVNLFNDHDGADVIEELARTSDNPAARAANVEDLS